LDQPVVDDAAIGRQPQVGCLEAVKAIRNGRWPNARTTPIIGSMDIHSRSRIGWTMFQNIEEPRNLPRQLRQRVRSIEAHHRVGSRGLIPFHNR
jgi:hypothetical protein